MSTSPLHERISSSLREKFKAEVVNASGKANASTPDLAIQLGQYLVLIEVKTGDPALPLPSSANAQMLILKDEARSSHAGADVVPVLVTNYMVDDADLKELNDGGIKVVPVSGFAYDPEMLSNKLKEIVQGQSAAEQPILSEQPTPSR